MSNRNGVTDCREGEVVALSVSGSGTNSGELQFTLRGDGQEETFRVGMSCSGSGDPDKSTEPQVFAAMATFLATAFATAAAVRVKWRKPTPDGPETPVASEIALLPR